MTALIEFLERFPEGVLTSADTVKETQNRIKKQGAQTFWSELESLTTSIPEDLLVKNACVTMSFLREHNEMDAVNHVNNQVRWPMVLKRGKKQEALVAQSMSPPANSDTTAVVSTASRPTAKPTSPPARSDNTAAVSTASKRAVQSTSPPARSDHTSTVSTASKRAVQPTSPPAVSATVLSVARTVPKAVEKTAHDLQEDGRDKQEDPRQYRAPDSDYTHRNTRGESIRTSHGIMARQCDSESPGSSSVCMYMDMGECMCMDDILHVLRMIYRCMHVYVYVYVCVWELLNCDCVHLSQTR